MKFIYHFLMHGFIKVFYRVNVLHQENVPLHGPAVLISSQGSWVHKLLIQFALGRRIFFLPSITSSKLRGVLREGRIVCLFLEKTISQKEIESVLKSLDKNIPIIPMCLSGTWGSAFSKAPSNAYKNYDRFSRFRRSIFCPKTFSRNTKANGRR